MAKDGYILRLRPNRAGLRTGLIGSLLIAGLFLPVMCVAASRSDSARVNTGKAAAGKITSVRFWTVADSTRIAIEVSTDFTYTADHLSNPDRLFFDIHGASPGSNSTASNSRQGLRAIQVGDALLSQIRVGETQPRVTRVVLDLVRSVTINTSQLVSPNRLMIELRPKGGPASPSIVTSANVGDGRDSDGKASKDTSSRNAGGSTSSLNSSPDSALKESPAKVSLSMEREAQAAALSAKRSKPEVKNFEPPPAPPKQTFAVQEPELPQPPRLMALAKPIRFPAMTITAPRELAPPPFAPPPRTPAPTAISIPPPVPSMGEPAAARTNSLSDPSLTRILGLKLGRIVLDPGHGGQDVGTHGPSGYLEKDLVLDVAQRLGALLEERLGSEVVFTRSDDTYISLEERTHIANQRKADLFLSIHANSSPYRSAAGVETYVLNFTPSKTAMELAARENASSSSSIHDLRGLVEKIAAGDKARESAEFAAKLQTSMSALSTRSNDAARNRGVKRAPFVVLIGAAMPSVLAEIGFLTNGEDEALLRKSEHRQKIAEALYKGIAAYAETLSRFDVARKN